MKVLFCTDVRLSAICMENLDVTHSRKWQAARMEKFVGLLDRAVQKGVTYVALFGNLFGQERVSEAVIDQFFAAVKAEKQIRVLAFLMADAYNRIIYRNDVPANLQLICTQTADTYTDEHIALRMNKGVAEIQLGEHEAVYILKGTENRFVLRTPDRVEVLPSFEPVGFEENLGHSWGYSILEWSAEALGSYTESEDRKYVFKAIELKLRPTDGEKQVLRKIDTAMKSMDADTFLRITISGRSAFGLTLSSDAIKAQLQKKIFFVEVYDNTVMDIDEEAFENDISLRSEFVRLALQDDSLSESERNRLISCGWNVLNGKEVSEQ